MHAFKRNLQNIRPLLVVLYLAFGGMLCACSAMVYAHVKPDLVVCFISVGIIFSIYVLNRFTDIREDFANDIKKYSYFLNRNILFKIALVAFAATIVLLIGLEKFKLYHFALISTGVFYSYRLVPWYSPKKGLVFIRLKEFPFIKNLMVALLWGASIFVVPYAFSHVQIMDYFPIIILGISITISTFTNTLFNDIRDKTGDMLANNKTLVVLWGEARCYLLLGIVNALWLGICILLKTINKIDWAHFVLLNVMLLYPLIYINLYKTKKFSRGWMDFLTESDLLLFAAGVSLIGLI
jgi:4-hydroxybenzoate polyprenyltransferase